MKKIKEVEIYESPADWVNFTSGISCWGVPLNIETSGNCLHQDCTFSPINPGGVPFSNKLCDIYFAAGIYVCESCQNIFGDYLRYGKNEFGVPVVKRDVRSIIYDSQKNRAFVEEVEKKNHFAKRHTSGVPNPYIFYGISISGTLQ